MSPYSELHAHSYFSLLDGASSPEDLVTRAAALGMTSLALTDHDAVYGAPRFVRAAHAAGIQPILGTELTLHDGSHLTLLVQNEIGWQTLCALITAARHNAVKGQAALPDGQLIQHTAGLIALSGCRQGAIASALLHKDPSRALHIAQQAINLFGRDCFWIELQNHLRPEDQRLNSALTELAETVGVGVVATNNVHYATREGQRLHDLLVCIRHNTSLDETSRLRPNSEYYLKSAPDLAPLFVRTPYALTNTTRIAAMCDFDLRNGLQDLPVFPTPDGRDAPAYLQHLCQQAMALQEWPSRAYGQLAHELQIIQACGLSNYFLIVWDIVRFARQQGILCQGRGSAANSLVAYVLGISPVNPLAHDLVFERFLSAERQVVPDIDIDFDAARREEVIQYVYTRYGMAHAAMACTFVTFRARSAIRDVGKAFGLPLDQLEQMTAALERSESHPVADIESHADNTTWQQVFQLAAQLEGLPRHLGIHNGGMVLTGSLLSQRVPTEPASMFQRFVTQWDKDALEDMGLVKIDILGLRMLSAIAETVDTIAQSGPRPDLASLTCDDPTVYDMICAADTIGVFQVESRAQAQLLPRLRPRTFNDLIVSISLIRPGPVQGNMVQPYLRRRLGLDPITYAHPRLEPALRETLGVILFQEQVLKVARDVAAFTAGQGEQLRRALGAKQPGEAVERFRQAFLAGATVQGIDAGTAQQIFDMLRAFGGYSFPKSHAAAFAVLVYHSAWLKRYHPAAFYTALLNHQPMGFWSPAVIVNDARRHRIGVGRVDINLSHARCTVEGSGIRLGLSLVHDMTNEISERIVVCRGQKPFKDLADVHQRVELPRHLLENLIAAGAMEGWGQARRDLFWQVGLLPKTRHGLDLAIPTETISLPTLKTHEQAGMEVAMTGISTGDHPLMRYRNHLRARGLLASSALRHCVSGQTVQVAGLLVVHQAPPTAKGYRFLTLEDEFGFINVIVHPEVYAQTRRIIREQPLLHVIGHIQHEGDVVNLIALTIQPLSKMLPRQNGT